MSRGDEKEEAEERVGVAGGRAPAVKGKAEEKDIDDGVEGGRNEEKLKEGTGAGVGTLALLLETAVEGTEAGAGAGREEVGEEDGSQVKGLMRVEPMKPVRLLSHPFRTPPLCPSSCPVVCPVPLAAVTGGGCCPASPSLSCSATLSLPPAGSAAASVALWTSPLRRGRVRP